MEERGLQEFSKAGLVVEVASEALGETILVASDNAEVNPEAGTVVYRAGELLLLLKAGATAEDVKQIHAAKRITRGRITEVREEPCEP